MHGKFLDSPADWLYIVIVIRALHIKYVMQRGGSSDEKNAISNVCAGNVLYAGKRQSFCQR
jgi:hypothetical protein